MSGGLSLGPVCGQLGADLGIVATLVPGSPQMPLQARYGQEHERVPNPLFAPPGSVLARVADSGQPRHLSKVLLLPAPGSGQRAMRLGTTLAAPVSTPSGEDVVVLAARRPFSPAFPAQALTALLSALGEPMTGTSHGAPPKVDRTRLLSGAAAKEIAANHVRQVGRTWNLPDGLVRRAQEAAAIAVEMHRRPASLDLVLELAPEALTVRVSGRGPRRRRRRASETGNGSAALARLCRSSGCRRTADGEEVWAVVQA